MRINQLPTLPIPPQSADMVAINRGGIDFKGPLGALANTHYSITIAASAWTLSSGTYTYTYTATDVDTDKQITWETDSTIENATATINITPGSGVLTFTTASRPNGPLHFDIVALGAAGDNVGAISGDVASLIAAIATEYDTSSTYTAPDYCWHSGVLYRCTSPTSVTGAWDATKWTAVTATDDLADFISAIASEYDPNGTYVYPSYCWHDGALYRSKWGAYISGAWDATKWTQITVCGEIATALSNILRVSVSGTTLVIQQGVTL